MLYRIRFVPQTGKWIVQITHSFWGGWSTVQSIALTLDSAGETKSVPQSFNTYEDVTKWVENTGLNKLYSTAKPQPEMVTAMQTGLLDYPVPKGYRLVPIAQAVKA